MQAFSGRLLKDHLWAWTFVMLGGLVVALVLRAWLGIGYHLGDLAALCGMAAGTFIMMHVDKGRMAQADAEDEA